MNDNERLREITKEKSADKRDCKWGIRKEEECCVTMENNKNL
jgi:hypothetical protein